MEGLYKINIVSSDLSTEETILQIADTLDNISGIVDDVFSRVMFRINQNMDKTAKLKERIEISKAKVDKLTGFQKAIKVFSSAKYPASISHEHYQSIFGFGSYKYEGKKVTLSGKPQGLPADKGIQEKLHFYHVKVADPMMPKPKQDCRLNAMINKIETVGELLVFNTDESPYLGSSNRVSAYVPAVKANIENTSLLEAAPYSIMKKDLMKREVDEYMYAPGMGMVPELDMPLDLPHLPGVAGDVQFLINSEGSIAPSVVTSPVVPVVPLPESELPDLKELPNVKPEIEIPLDDAPDAPPPRVAPSTQALMPLPPPPPPPPPPPLPAPVELTLTTHTNSAEKSSVLAPPQTTGDAHSDLMAAIRRAGGAGRAKLRPAADTDAPNGMKAAPTGDLMADLHAKLSMRRRGISGAERSGGGSVLHTLASVIPEPADSSPQRSSDDDDWE